MLSAEQIPYARGALVPSGAADAEPIEDFVATGRPGTRLPHRWLDDGHRRSSLDLAGPGWAVLGSGSPGERLLVRPDGIVAWRGPCTEDPERIRRGLLRAPACP